MEARLAAEDGQGASGRRKVASWLAVWTSLAALLGGCRLIENRVNDPTPRKCAECHVEITRQWAGSAHATAWTDPVFLNATHGRRPQQCLPCHAPGPLLDQSPDESPKLRAEHHEDGVDCGACHQSECGYVGPYRSWGPHPTRQDRTRLPTTGFCATCHVVEAEEHESYYLPSLDANQTPKGCVGCHMPPGQSRLTQDHLLSYVHPQRLVRDHSFPVWTEEVLRNAVEVEDFEVRRRDEIQLDVSFNLINRGAGHRIPTGHFGHRYVKVSVTLFDGKGDPLDHEEWPLYARRVHSLVPGKPTSFKGSLLHPRQSKPVRVRLSVERISQDRSLFQTLLESEWPLDEHGP